MSKHKLELEEPPAKRIKISQEAISQQSNMNVDIVAPNGKASKSINGEEIQNIGGLDDDNEEEVEDDDIKTNNKKHEDEYLTIEIDGQSDKFKLKTLKQMVFFQAKFSQRWSKSVIQKSNQMSLKDVGFKMKELKALIDCIEGGFKALNLAIVDGYTWRQLRDALEPFLLCIAFFEPDEKIVNCIETAIAQYFGNYVPPICLIEREKWLQEEKCQILIESLKKMNKTVEKICRDNAFNHGKIGDNTKIKDATRRIKSFFKKLCHLTELTHAQCKRLLKTWKIIINHEFLEKDSYIQHTVKTCLEMNVIELFKFSVNHQDLLSIQAKALFEIIEYLLLLEKVEWKDKLELLHKQLHLASIIGDYGDKSYNCKFDFFHTFGNAVKNMTQEEAQEFVKCAGNKLEDSSFQYREYEIKCNDETAENLIKFFELILTQTKMNIDNFFKNQLFGLTMLKCLCQTDIGTIWLQKQFYQQYISSIAIGGYLRKFVKHLTKCWTDEVNDPNTDFSWHWDYPTYVWKMYNNVIKILIKLGAAMDELEVEVVFDVIKIRQQHNGVPSKIFESIENNLSSSHFEKLLVYLYTFGNPDDIPCVCSWISMISNKVNFCRVCYSICDNYDEYDHDMDGVITGLFEHFEEDLDELQNWFENVFIGQQQKDTCSAKIQESMAQVLGSKYLAKGKFQQCKEMINFVNDTLGSFSFYNSQFN